MGVDIRTVIGWTANLDLIKEALESIRVNLNPDPDDFRDALHDHGILHSGYGDEFYIVAFADANAEDGITELEDMNDGSYVAGKFVSLRLDIDSYNDDEDVKAALHYLVGVMFKYGRLALLTYWC